MAADNREGSSKGPKPTKKRSKGSVRQTITSVPMLIRILALLNVFAMVFLGGIAYGINLVDAWASIDTVRSGTIIIVLLGTFVVNLLLSVYILLVHRVSRVRTV